MAAITRNASQLALQIVKFLITFGIVVSINSNLHWLFIATTSLHLHPSSLLPLLRTLARIRLLSYARTHPPARCSCVRGARCSCVRDA